MQIGNYYRHFCSHCLEKTQQRFEGYIYDCLDELHREMFPEYRDAYEMTCLVCKSTRTYGVDRKLISGAEA